ncbi:MAG: FKBP-type peptidyl-prolyl cis-trans isomerase [Pseudomonadota bacterium]
MKPILALATVLLAPLCLAGEPPDLGSDNAKINYSIGYQVGKDFSQQGLELQPDIVLRGITDAHAGAEPLLSPEEMRTTMGNLGKRLADERTKKKYTEKLDYIKAGREFLEANAKKAGVVTTASGLQYLILQPGSGRTPTATDTVTVNYRGTLIDGTEFDSSYRRGKPATFRVDAVIPGWTEALQLMQEGAKWQLFIPYKLAYGDRGQLRERDLIFEVELLSVDTPPAATGANTAPGS